MIIEFLGNTGAGKSTLVPILAQLLRDDDRLVMSVAEAVRYYTAKTLAGRIVCALAPVALRGPLLRRAFSWFISRLHLVQFVIDQPRLIGYVVRSQLRRSIPWRHRWLIVGLYLQMVSEYHFVSSRSQPGDVLILDEGFVHRAVHMFVSESEQLDPDRVRQYLELLPQPQLVIWVRAPLDICLARIYDRGLQVRLKSRAASDVERFVTNSERVVNIAAQYLRDAGWSVVEIANNSDLSLSAAELRHDVAPYFVRQASLVA
jgi:thymidylate kinase